MWFFLRGFIAKLLTDESTKLPSFGKSIALPFLISAWVLGTIYSVILLKHWSTKDSEISDLIWTMASVAMVLYITYKTGHVAMSRGASGKVSVEKDSTPPTT
jgi:uncharacterized membrane protein (DUF485 family)